MVNEIITGQQITKLITINSMYSNDCIQVYDDKNRLFYLELSEFVKFDTDFNSLKFEIVKKIKRNYLKVIQEDPKYKREEVD